MKLKKTTIALLIIAMIFAAGNSYAQPFTSIGKGILHILGIGLTVDPGGGHWGQRGSLGSNLDKRGSLGSNLDKRGSLGSNLDMGHMVVI